MTAAHQTLHGIWQLVLRAHAGQGDRIKTCVISISCGRAWRRVAICDRLGAAARLRDAGESDEREREFKEMVIDEFLSFVDDPRVEGRSKHSLETILVIALMAVICGADGFVAIERFAIAKQAWLSGFLDMSGGVPSHDTIGRVFALLNPKSLAEAFRRWSIRVSPTVTTKVVSSSSVHVDGSRCAAWEALTTRANVSVDARGATPLRFRPRRDCSTFPAAVAFDLSLGDESMRLPLVP